MRDNSSGDHEFHALWPSRPRRGAGFPAPRGAWPWSSAPLSEHVRSRAPFITETASHLMEAGGKRFRPLLVLLAAGRGPSRERRGGHGRLRRRAHAPGLALPRRRDGRGGPAPGATTALPVEATTSRSLTGDFPVLQVLRGSPPSSAWTRRADPGADLHPPRGGPDPRTVAPGPGEDPLAHYLDVVAGKTGSLIATSALRRPVRGRPRTWRRR